MRIDRSLLHERNLIGSAHRLSRKAWNVGLTSPLRATLLLVLVLLRLLVLRVAAPPAEPKMPAPMAALTAAAALSGLAALIAGASARLTAALSARVIFVHIPCLSIQPNLSNRKLFILS